MICNGIILPDVSIRLNKIPPGIISSYPAKSASLCSFWNFANGQQVSGVPSNIIL